MIVEVYFSDSIAILPFSAPKKKIRKCKLRQQLIKFIRTTQEDGEVWCRLILGHRHFGPSSRIAYERIIAATTSILKVVILHFQNQIKTYLYFVFFPYMFKPYNTIVANLMTIHKFNWNKPNRQNGALTEDWTSSIKVDGHGIWLANTKVL